MLMHKFVTIKKKKKKKKKKKAYNTLTSARVGSHAVLLLPYIRVSACVTSSDIIPHRILRDNRNEKTF